MKKKVLIDLLTRPLVVPSVTAESPLDLERSLVAYSILDEVIEETIWLKIREMVIDDQ